MTEKYLGSGNVTYRTATTGEFESVWAKVYQLPNGMLRLEIDKDDCGWDVESITISRNDLVPWASRIRK